MLTIPWKARAWQRLAASCILHCAMPVICSHLADLDSTYRQVTVPKFRLKVGNLTHSRTAQSLHEAKCSSLSVRGLPWDLFHRGVYAFHMYLGAGIKGLYEVPFEASLTRQIF